jgi:integration host factor subunit beta
VTRSELIEQLVTQKEITTRRSEQIICEIFDAMGEALIDGERIEVRGFGTFSVKEYGTYQGRNPKTGGPIEVKPKKLPFFKVGKELKERILGAP